MMPPPLLLAACLASAVAAGAAEPPPAGPSMPPLQQEAATAPPAEQPKQPWIGCFLLRPDPAVAAQIPELPPGVGLLVHSVSPDSPASDAKLQANDIIWKFRDQWLINQAQLAVLLRNATVGQEVRLAVFRSGKSIELPVTLAAAPESCRDGFFFDHGGMSSAPPIIVDKSHGSRTASAKTSQGHATMTRQDDSYQVTIKDPEGKVLFTQDLPETGRWSDLPQGWHRTLYALRRSLDNTEESALAPVRPPRQRVIQPQPDNQPPPRPQQQ
jgi:hypothetical protein